MNERAPINNGGICVNFTWKHPDVTIRVGRCFHHKDPNMTCSSRQKKAMQIPLKQSWKKVSRPRSHKETRAKEQQLKLITAVNSNTIHNLATDHSGQLYYHYAELQGRTGKHRRTTSTLDCCTPPVPNMLTRISALQSPKRTKRISAHRNHLLLWQARQDIQLDLTLCTKDHAPRQGPMQFDSVTWTNQVSNLQGCRRTLAERGGQRRGYQGRSCFPSNRLPRKSSSCSGVCLTYFPGALLFSMRGLQFDRDIL